MSASFEGMTRDEAVEFADRWLPAWTGNDPERLASFYTDDAFYSDPAIPDGVEGREALTRYFTALLVALPRLGVDQHRRASRSRAASSTSGTRRSRSGAS